jgi:hypothetical protein
MKEVDRRNQRASFMPFSAKSLIEPLERASAGLT